MRKLTIDGYPTDSLLGLPTIEVEEYTFCSIIKDPVGPPPPPSAATAEVILARAGLLDTLILDGASES